MSEASSGKKITVKGLLKNLFTELKESLKSARILVIYIFLMRGKSI